jgi:succinyl-CoA synthetase beta subunit
VKAGLINVFGGITRCDEVARGLLLALDQVKPKIPIVVRLVGTNEAEGREILAQAKLETVATLERAAQRAIELAG